MYQDPEKGETDIELSQLPQTGYTSLPLHKAAEDLDFEAICTLIKIEDVNMKDQDGNTVLHKSIAVIRGHTEYVLVEGQLVAFSRKIDVISILLDQKDIDLNSQNNKGQTPLHLALVQSDKLIISLVLSNTGMPIDLDIQNCYNESCRDLLEEKYPEMILFHLLYQGRTEEFINLAKTKGNLLEKDDGYNTFLQSACEHRSVIIVKELLGLGVEPNRTSPTNKKWPSKIAAINGYSEILRIILEYYYNLREANDGNTVIHALVREEEQDYKNRMTECLLLDNNLDINAINNEGYTAMHLAIIQGDEEIISILLSRKDVDLDSYEYEGKKFREILEEKYPKILLFHYLHSEKDLKFNDLARSKRHLLEENYRGRTFLQHACKKGLNKIVKTLLDLRVDPMRSGKKHLDMAPFIIVIYKGFYKILEIFLECPRFLVKEYPDVLFRLLLVMVENRVRNPTDDTDYNICLDLLLRETRRGKLDINWLNKDEETILDVAIICDMDDIIFKLLDAGIFIGNTNKNGIHTLERLDPLLLRKHLDNCISTNSEESIRVITFNYRSLIPPTKMKSSKSQSIENLTVASIETDLLISMCRFAEFKKLLKHPLITSFLNLKWFAVQKIFYINLIFYFTLCLLFTVYVSCKYVSWSINDSSNVTETFLLNSTTTSEPNIPESESYKWLHYAMAIFWGIFCLRELVQFCTSPLRYLKSAENMLEVMIIVTGASILFPISSDFNPGLVAVFALTSWSEAVLLLGRHPKMCIYIEMFKTVTLNFLSFLFLYSILVWAFALSFCFLFIENTQFVNPFLAFFQISIIMMTGEYDASDFDFGWLPLVSRIFFLLFVFLIAMVLSNLLNGLAVGDIEMIRSDAELSEIMYRIKMYQSYENMPILNILSNMFDSLINVAWLGNWIHAKLKILKSWFTVVLFPGVIPTYKAYICQKYGNFVYFDLKSDHFFNKLPTSRFQRLFKWQINSDIVEAATIMIEEKSNSVRENTMEDLVEYCAEQLKLYKPKLEIDRRNEEMLKDCCKQFETVKNISERLHTVEKFFALNEEMLMMLKDILRSDRKMRKFSKARARMRAKAR